jgi:hypothetical protein
MVNGQDTVAITLAKTHKSIETLRLIERQPECLMNPHLARRRSLFFALGASTIV